MKKKKEEEDEKTRFATDCKMSSEVGWLQPWEKE